MKISYQHIIEHIPTKPCINEISQKLFQLGHEHEIENEVLNMELTPNRGDCLSLNGILKDLAVFYKIDLRQKFYEHSIKEFEFNFINNAVESCPNISFLRIDIDENISPYKGCLKSYFEDINISKNNFFTDISNYVSYETGQPTHCYDAKKIKEPISLDLVEEDIEFNTLLNKKISLTGKNLVFSQNNNEVINLAGVIGGINTSCESNTLSVFVECAYFNPEDIISKSTKYDVKSDAAHKFERGVDPLCHENILRRFLQIVSEHTTIKNVALFQRAYKNHTPIKIDFSKNKINNILGTSCSEDELKEYLLKLGFKADGSFVYPPSYRGDIKIENDVAEEIARAIGYNNIVPKSFNIANRIIENNIDNNETRVKNILNKNGFFEVINNPFVKNSSDISIKVDNPLDSNRRYLRTNLKKSLLENLLYNERRQQDSIKLFEISDIYEKSSNSITSKKLLGIICSGRIGKNYIEFSKKIDETYLSNIIKELDSNLNFSPVHISRDSLNTKIKNKIFYTEIDLSDIKNICVSDKNFRINTSINFFKYEPISDYPFSSRDLSFSIKSHDSYNEIQELLLNYKHKFIKEIFIFDFYNSKQNDEIKIGFRFIFQSKTATIKENQVNEIINNIIESALSISSVEIPGLRN